MKELINKVLLLFLIVFIFELSSEVTINTAAGNNATVTLKNNTSRNWDLGGWRFQTNKNTFQSVEGNGYLACINEAKNGGYEHTTQATTIAPQWAIQLAMGASESYLSAGWGSGDGLTFDNPYVLLKTSSSGAPDKPVDENPITLDQLDSLMATSNFYDESYRYKDSLGANGGRFSGGLLDTWFGQTQVQLAVDGANFSGVSFSPNSTGGPIYWMTLAMGQEYFNIDMQWMIGFGVKETWAGVSGAPYNGTNIEGAYGCWEVEAFTGLDRALGYFTYYPEYAAQLSVAVDVTNSGIDEHVWAKDYTNDPSTNSTPINSSFVVGAYMISITNMHGLYGLLSYAEDLCWKEGLDGAKDPYLGVLNIGPLYNLGATNVAGISSPMNKDNYESTKLMDDASSLFPEGNSGYAPAIIGMVQNLVNASTNALSDPSIPIWDYSIPWSDVERFFLGDGGTINKQGNSGLLKHFVVDDVAKRTTIMNNIKAAFDKLKGKSPSTSGSENISFRYDWVALLRTVKENFSVDGFYAKPGGGGLSMLISQNSTIGGCSIDERDTTYPYGEIISQTYDDDFELEVKGSDNKNIKDITWTINSDWNSWQQAVYLSGSGGDQNFEIVVPKQQIKNIYGEGAGTLWFMVTDESGNSIVKSVSIKGNPLKSAAAVDTKGDGKADKINVHIIDDALESTDNASSPSSLKYNWPTQSPLNNASGINHTIDLLSFAPANDDGDGLGIVELLYPSMEGNSATKDVVDSIGPAVQSATYKFGENDNDPCTLTVVLTEDIEEISDASIDYLKINGNVIAQKEIKKGSNSLIWVFIIDPSVAINNGDVLKLVHNTGIVDVSPQNNPPLDINNEVPIKVIKMSESLELLSATFEDVDANGKMDKITFEINGPAVTNDDLDNVTFKVTWLNASENIDTIIISGSDLDNNMSYKLSDNQSIKQDLTAVNADSSFGKVTFIHKVINSEKWDTTIYNDVAIDKMAPVLVTADYYIYKSNSVSDEMIVTFSEDVSNMSNSEPFTFNDGSYKLSLNLESLTGNVVEFSVSGNSTTPKDGDSVNINYEAGVKDKAGNEQDNQSNKHVMLNIASAIGILNVSYHDLSAPRDGYIDVIKVITDIKIDKSIFDSLVNKIKLNESRNFKPLKVSDFVPFTNSGNGGFLISVSQNEGTEKNTATTEDDKFVITDDVKSSAGFIMNLTADIIDSLAPVITGAFLYPVEITKENYQDLISDTLKIEFSESVDFDAMEDNPFNFKKINDFSLTVDLTKTKAEKDNFLVYLIDYSSNKPKDGDSVQIATTGNVSDNKDNLQNNDNIFVEIKAAVVPFHWNIGVYPNPVLKDNENQVKEKMKNLSDYLQISADDIKKGVQAIILDPLGPAPSSESLEISVTICDALGNVVVDNEAFEVSSDGEVWYYLWEGKNQKGRDVGSGLYLAYIKINPDSMGIISEPLKLGVGK